MSHFYASIAGKGTQRTTTGTKASGITGHIRGWDIGASVHVGHDSTGDYVTVFLTHGSNNPGHAQCLGRFRIGPDGEFTQIP